MHRPHSNHAARRRASVNVHPGLFPRSQHSGNPFVRGKLLVPVGGSELGVGDLECASTHTTVVVAVERDVSMMRLAGCRHDLRVFDSYQRRLESRQLVPLSLEHSSKCSQLHGFLLESATRGLPFRRRIGSFAVDQPRYPEPIDYHAKTRGPACLLQRHHNPAVLAKLVKNTLGVSRVLGSSKLPEKRPAKPLPLPHPYIECAPQRRFQRRAGYFAVALHAVAVAYRQQTTSCVHRQI